MKIQLTTPEQFEEVRSFYHSLIDGMAAAGTPISWKKDIYPAPEALRSALDEGAMYLGYEGDRIAAAMVLDKHSNEGYAAVEWLTEADDDEVMVIHMLGVHPDFGQKGLGREMVEFAQKMAVDSGKTVIRLDVLVGNDRPERLYRRCGFQYVTTLPMYYENTGRVEFRFYEWKVPKAAGRVYIVRHGQTEQNLKKKLQGRSDFPLTELGREQAAAVGDAFREAGIVFDQVYTSPLDRAVETAKLIAGDAPIDVEEALIEMDYGPYEGIDLFDLPPEVEEFFRDFTNHPAPDGMEQLSSVVARAGEFLERLKAEAVHRDILLSTHAIAMKGLLEYLTPESNGAYWSTFIGNCAVYVTEYHDGTYTVPTEWSK